MCHVIVSDVAVLVGEMLGAILRLYGFARVPIIPRIIVSSITFSFLSGLDQAPADRGFVMIYASTCHVQSLPTFPTSGLECKIFRIHHSDMNLRKAGTSHGEGLKSPSMRSNITKTQDC